MRMQHDARPCDAIDTRHQGDEAQSEEEWRTREGGKHLDQLEGCALKPALGLPISNHSQPVGKCAIASVIDCPQAIEWRENTSQRKSFHMKRRWLQLEP